MSNVHHTEMPGDDGGAVPAFQSPLVRSRSGRLECADHALRRCVRQARFFNTFSIRRLCRRSLCEALPGFSGSGQLSFGAREKLPYFARQELPITTPRWRCLCSPVEPVFVTGQVPGRRRPAHSENRRISPASSIFSVSLISLRACGADEGTATRTPSTWMISLAFFLHCAKSRSSVWVTFGEQTWSTFGERRSNCPVSRIKWHKPTSRS